MKYNLEFFYSVADDECYPYQAAVERCLAKKSDNLRTMGCKLPSNQRESLYKMGPAYSLNNETDIMWEISTYGPVQGLLFNVLNFMIDLTKLRFKAHILYN